jgi:hypothetical protein
MERDHHRRPLQRQLAGHAGLAENLYLGRGATCAAVVARHRAMPISYARDHFKQNAIHVALAVSQLK